GGADRAAFAHDHGGRPGTDPQGPAPRLGAQPPRLRRRSARSPPGHAPPLLGPGFCTWLPTPDRPLGTRRSGPAPRGGPPPWVGRRPAALDVEATGEMVTCQSRDCDKFATFR